MANEKIHTYLVGDVVRHLKTSAAKNRRSLTAENQVIVETFYRAQEPGFSKHKRHAARDSGKRIATARG